MASDPKTKAVALKQKAAVTKGKSTALGTALDPSMQSLYNVCLALSKSSAVPMQYIGKPDWIFSTVVLGKEFGLGPMSSLMNISTINGKPSMSVHLLLGLCMRHPEFAGWRVVRSTADECTVEMFRMFKHQKEPTRFEGRFTKEEAMRAGLVKNGGAWISWARNMCKARAIAFVCRECFADVLTGAYTLEEMDSEKYVDSFMAEDLKAVDELEAADLDGRALSTSDPAKARTPVAGTKPVQKIVPRK